MKTAVLFVGHDVSSLLLKKYACPPYFLIGVDQGAAKLAKEGIRMNVAVGDFDSASKEDVFLIEKMADFIEKLNPIKDDTDTAHALTLCKGFEKVIILGATQGKRIEHLFANTILLQNDLRVEMIDDHSSIRCLGPGAYSFEKNEYKFFSLFAIEPSELSLNGFAYDLNEYTLQPNDPLCVSNQIAEEAGELSLKEGKVLLILSKAD